MKVKKVESTELTYYLDSPIFGHKSTKKIKTPSMWHLPFSKSVSQENILKEVNNDCWYIFLLKILKKKY